MGWELPPQWLIGRKATGSSEEEAMIKPLLKLLLPLSLMLPALAAPALGQANGSAVQTSPTNSTSAGSAASNSTITGPATITAPGASTPMTGFNATGLNTFNTTGFNATSGGLGASSRTGGTGASATSGGAVAGPARPEVLCLGNDDVLSRTATDLSCVP
jgi:hypothetical protein